MQVLWKGNECRGLYMAVMRKEICVKGNRNGEEEKRKTQRDRNFHCKVRTVLVQGWK
jgi:hypothetical protein